MPATLPIVTRISAALATTPGVREVPMKNGALFMVNGKVCVSVRGDIVSFRVGKDIFDEAIKKKGARIMTMKKSTYRGYVDLNESSITKSKDMRYWVELALVENARLRTQ